MRLVINEQSRTVYELDGTTLIDAAGNKMPVTMEIAVLSKWDAILEFEYMKRRVLMNDLVCSYNNLGTKFERWWQAHHFSPNGRVLSKDGKFSCRIQDAVPLKYLPKVSNLFESDYEYELWIMAVTSKDNTVRFTSQQLLSQMVSKLDISNFISMGEHSSD